MRLRHKARHGGSAVLEFAVGSGVLLAALTGTFRFGYSFLQYNRLTNAVIQGARYASIVPYDSASFMPSAAFLSSVPRDLVADMLRVKRSSRGGSAIVELSLIFVLFSTPVIGVMDFG
jgi:Flp pilus assembly protein TadG